MHFSQNIALFLKLSITCFVSRTTPEVIKLIKLSRIENQKMFIFSRRFIGKIYLQNGDISCREFSLSAF